MSSTQRRQVRNEIADPLAALAVLPPFPRAGHHGAGLALEQLDLAPRVELLAVLLDQRRLIVKRVALAGRARHEQVNDSLGPGEMMQPAVVLGPRLERFSRRRYRQGASRPPSGGPARGRRNRRRLARGSRGDRCPARLAVDARSTSCRIVRSMVASSRRDPLIADGPSVDEDKLVGVPEQAAGVRQAVLGGIRGRAHRARRRGVLGPGRADRPRRCGARVIGDLLRAAGQILAIAAP